MFIRKVLFGVASSSSLGAISFLRYRDDDHHHHHDYDDDDDVPLNATLRQVIMIHRHGDRAPCGKRLGTKIVVECDTEDSDKEFWASRLPSEGTLQHLYKRFGFKNANVLIDEYNGRVTGKLTQKGFDELKDLGSRLRSRYHHRLKFLPSSLDDQNKQIMYLRSTPMSRCVC